jgi:hypothetical protein
MTSGTSSGGGHLFEYDTGTWTELPTDTSPDAPGSGNIETIGYRKAYLFGQLNNDDEGFISYFDNGTWTSLTVPGGTNDFWTVHDSEINPLNGNVYFVGGPPNYDNTGTSFIYKIDLATPTKVSVLHQIDGFHGMKVMDFADDGTGCALAKFEGKLGHLIIQFDEAGYTIISAASFIRSKIFGLADIDCISSNEMWLVGVYFNGYISEGQLVHCINGQCTAYFDPSVSYTNFYSTTTVTHFGG